MLHERTLAGPFCRTLFDVKFFNFDAKSCLKTIRRPQYHVSVKTLKYQLRVLDVEHSSFVLLIFAFTGGGAPGSTKTVRKKVEKLSEKRNESYLDESYFYASKSTWFIRKILPMYLYSVGMALSNLRMIGPYQRYLQPNLQSKFKKIREFFRKRFRPIQSDNVLSERISSRSW